MSTLNSELKEVRAMYKTVEEQLQLLEEMNDRDCIQRYGLHKDIYDILKNVSRADIEKFTYRNCVAVLKLLALKERTDTGEFESRFDTISRIYESDKKEPGEVKSDYEDEPEWTEYVKGAFLEIKDALQSMEDLYASRDDIKHTIDDMETNYIEYLQSDEYKEKKQKYIAEQRERAEALESNYEKQKLLKELDAAEHAKELQFILDEIEKNPEAIVKRVKNSFFSSNSSYTLERYKQKIKKLGFDEKIHQAFFNLEENFLEDEYNPYNNLFLYHVMSYIAHIDLYNKVDTLHATTLIQSIYKLVYHRYETVEEEERVKNVIRKFDSYFKGEEAHFKLKNKTSPDHPVRRLKDREHEEKERAMAIAGLENLGKTPDTTVDTQTLLRELKEALKEKEEKDKEEYGVKVADAVRVEKEKEVVQEVTETLVKESEEPEAEEDAADVEEEIESTDTEGIKDESSEDADGLQGIVTEEIREESGTDTEVEVGRNVSDNEDTAYGGDSAYSEPIEIDIDEVVDDDMLKELIADGQIEMVPTSEESTPATDATVPNDAEAEASDSMVVSVEHNDEAEEKPFSVYDIGNDDAIYLDASNCFYHKKENGMYDCYSKTEVIEEDVPEEEVLRLASSGFVVRRFFSDVKDKILPPLE